MQNGAATMENGTKISKTQTNKQTGTARRPSSPASGIHPEELNQDLEIGTPCFAAPRSQQPGQGNNPDVLWQVGNSRFIVAMQINNTIINK